MYDLSCQGRWHLHIEVCPDQLNQAPSPPMHMLVLTADRYTWTPACLCMVVAAFSGARLQFSVAAA